MSVSPPARVGSISVTGIEVFAHHGVLAEERERGQWFLVDLEMHLDLGHAASSDDLSDTIDYGEISRKVHDLVAGARWNLLERVANRVAAMVMEDQRVQRVTVTVHKPAAPIEVAFGDVAVTVSLVRG